MATSSHMTKAVLGSNSVVPLCFVKLHIVLLSSLMGILKRECAVHPPGMILTAIPDVAVPIAIRFIERTFASKALYRYV